MSFSESHQPIPPSEPLTSEQIGKLLDREDLQVSTYGKYRVRCITSEAKTHELNQLAQTLLTAVENSNSTSIEKDIESSEKLLDIYDRTDPTFFLRKQSRKDLQKKINELNRNRLVSYLNDQGATPKDSLDQLAMKLLKKNDALMSNSNAKIEEIQELISYTKKLLRLYKTESPTFSIFGQSRYPLKLRQMIFNPSLTVHKTSTAFSSIFPKRSPSIDKVRKERYGSADAAYRRNLDHKPFTPLEARLHNLEQLQRAQNQLETEKPGRTFRKNQSVIEHDHDQVNISASEDVIIQPDQPVVESDELHLSRLNAESFDISSKSQAKALWRSLSEMRENDQGVMCLGETPLDIPSITQKLFTAMESIPPNCGDRREIDALCYQMLAHLETAVTRSSQEHKEIIARSQTKRFIIENRLLDSCSKTDWDQITVYIDRIKTSSSTLESTTDWELREQLQSQINTDKQRIVSIAFAGILRITDPEKRLEQLEENYKQVLDAIPPFLDFNTNADCSSEAVEQFLDSRVDNFQIGQRLPKRDISEVSYKTTPAFTSESLEIAACETTGRNDKGLRTMEDKSVITAFDVTVGKRTYPVLVSGIFDGHGGDLAASYAKHFYPAMLQRRLEQCSPDLRSDEITNALALTTVDLHEAWCEYCDKKIKSLEKQRRRSDSNIDEIIEQKKQQLTAGTTSATMVKIGEEWYLSSVGDSRILFVSESGTVTQLSADATPENQQKEIEARFGILSKDKTTFSSSGLSTGGAIGDCFVGLDETPASIAWSVADYGVNPRSSVTRLSQQQVEEGGILFAFDDGYTEMKDEQIGKIANSTQIGEFVSHNKTAPTEAIALGLTKEVIRAGSQDNCSTIFIKIKPKARA